MSAWAAKPPSGYEPGQTRAPLVWDISVPLAIVAVTLACLRFYVRICLVKVIGKDDWLLFIAVISLFGLVGSELWGVSLGVGKRQYDVFREKDPRVLIPSGVMVQVFYNLCQCCVQCSILAFYLRLGLAKISETNMQRIIYVLMGFSILNNIVSACLYSVFSATEAFLLQSKRYLTVLWFTSGALNLLMDLIIWYIPMPAIIAIMHNLPTKKKILLILAFAVGMMSWISAILRISFRKYMLGLGEDPTYNGPIFNVLLVAEVTLAISCVSVATFRPLVVKITKGFNRLRGKPISANKNSRTTDPEFGASLSPAGSKGYGSSTGGSRTTGNKGGFGHCQELMEWKDDVSDIKSSAPQFVQQTCSCHCRDGDVELGSVVAHAPSCPRGSHPTLGTQLQVPAPAAIDHSTTHRSSNSSSRETLRSTNIGSPSWPPLHTLPSSESTAKLTNANISSTTDYPKPLV